MEGHISEPVLELNGLREPLPLAIIANEQTPYRLHLHRRICREMPDIQLWSIFTHEVASSPWKYEDDPEIRPVLFGKGESSAPRNTPGSAAREWRKGGEIVRWLATHGVKAIVLFGYNDAARLRIVTWAGRAGVPCFVFGDSNSRCDRATALKALVKRAYVPWVLRQAAGVFHCGRLGREYFLRYGVPRERLYEFPYEPDYSLFAGSESFELEAARRRYGLREGKRFLLFAGRMVEAKRPDLLLDAFEGIAGARPEWELVMAGDGPLRRELEGRCSSALRRRIHWLGFIADSKELATVYAACDVFVLPSDFEPWGVVLTEAATLMALVASSTTGAAADVIEEGVNGRTFLRGDSEALRSALMEVTNPTRIDRMKTASPSVLSRWRQSSDPLRSLRRALENARLLPVGGCVHAG